MSHSIFCKIVSFVDIAFINYAHMSQHAANMCHSSMVFLEVLFSAATLTQLNILEKNLWPFAWAYKKLSTSYSTLTNSFESFVLNHELVHKC